MKLKLVHILCLTIVAPILFSVAPLCKDWPPVETAYTQDGSNCVRGRVRDRDNKPIAAARVTLLIESSLAAAGMTETDSKGEFLFRSVPLKEELVLMVEADGYMKATVPGITIRPPYSCVITVRLQKEDLKK